MGLMKKSAAFLVVLALFGLIVVGFVGAQEKVEIEFWTFWGSETRRPIIEKIVTDFNESQDQIHVTHVFNPWGDIWTKSLAAIAAGNPPDVVIASRKLPRLMTKDFTPAIKLASLPAISWDGAFFIYI